jgi:hypothetical protein
MARTPVRTLIEKGIEAGADYIPDVFEVLVKGSRPGYAQGGMTQLADKYGC